jgi:hypothetical protein
VTEWVVGIARSTQDATRTAMNVQSWHTSFVKSNEDSKYQVGTTFIDKHEGDVDVNKGAFKRWLSTCPEQTCPKACFSRARDTASDLTLIFYPNVQAERENS